MANNIFRIVIIFFVLFVPASVFARELINNSTNLHEVLQTEESSQHAQNTTESKYQIKGNITAEKSRVPCLRMSENFAENTFLSTVPLMPWLPFLKHTYSVQCKNLSDEAGFAFMDAGLIENPDDPGFPIGIPQVRLRTPSLEWRLGDPRDFLPVARCVTSRN